MEYNEIGKIIKEWEKCVKDWEKAIKDKDIKLADEMETKTKDAYSRYKKEVGYQGKVKKTDAGMLGEMFESALPTLFLKNRKAVGSVISLIKEDSNLRNQLQFFDAMKHYDGQIDAKDFVNESVELAKKGIDRKSLNESNRKLSKLFVYYNIKPDDSLDEDKENFIKAGTYLLTHDRKLSNLSEIAKNRKTVEDYIVKHKKEINENKINLKNVMENFDKKMSILNEDEKSLVKDILDCKSSVAEQRQKTFFESLKLKCVSKIDELKNSSSDTEKASLESLREDIQNMPYCKESIVKDTAKLLEIGAVLSDNK